jgi:hypothetical protein
MLFLVIKKKRNKMPEQQQDYITPLLSDFSTKLREIEEKQKLLKDRVLLIGENLITSREGLDSEINELKIQAEQTKQDILKIKETLQRIIEELDNRARKSEVDNLKKQARMFQPLELARIEDVEKMIKQSKGE